ncbi:DUF222 domain-containing protein [Arthrobacter rhombi]|uniref:DUF222 domain-containing protein n=1 Tax=Arthrobacter rhombi TaxID=71253 RepID=UPI003FD4973B
MDQDNEAQTVTGWTLTRLGPTPVDGSSRFKAAEALSRFAEAEKFRAAAMLHDEAQQAIDPRLEALTNRPGMRISLRTGRIISYAATDSAALEIALIAGLSPGQGHRVLDQAETLVMDTPEVLESLALGRIGASHVQRILEHTQHITAEPVALPARDADEASKEEFERRAAASAARARADRRDFGADMLAIAPGKSPSQLRARGRQVLERYYGFSFTKRSRAALRGRRISLEEGRDGMTWFSGYLPSASCQAIFSKIDAMARLLKTAPETAVAVSDAATQAAQGPGTEESTGTGTGLLESAGGDPDASLPTDDPGEFRTLDQLRADVFTDIMLNGPRGQGLETVDAQVFVTIPATMLPGTAGGPTNIDDTPINGPEPDTGTAGGANVREGIPAATPVSNHDQAGLDVPGGLAVAELTPGAPLPTILGGGPIDQQSAARLMVAARSWWRVITDPLTGAVVKFGQRRYRPTAAQRAILQFRDGSCTTPGCTGSGRTCEIDHTQEWQHGGGTDIANLRLGCKRCHRLKSLGLLEVEQRAGGTILVTSLFGTRRVGYPAAPWAVADPWQTSQATGSGGEGPPVDPDAVIPPVVPLPVVRPKAFTIESSTIERECEKYQDLQIRLWGRIQEVPDSSCEAPQRGRYALTTHAKAARKRRLKRNAGEYGPPAIHRPDDRGNPLHPEPGTPDKPPEKPPF